MTSNAESPLAYIEQLPDERKEAVSKLRATIKTNLPEGFEECMGYGMLAYVVPQSIYPDGYHCNPKLPLPFINLASQKNFIALYHSGIYASNCKRKIDMGKSCIRFKNINDIPYDLIGELCAKITVAQWIEQYEKNIKK